LESYYEEISPSCFYIFVAGSVSAAGFESMVLEAEPLVEQTNVSGDQESMLVQIILILATLFILL